MGKRKTKEWKFIGTTTHEWVSQAYPSAISRDTWKYKDRMNNFLEFMGLTDSEFVEGYKRAKDRHEWARRMGFKAVAFYNHRIKKGYATNTARAEVSTVRAFCRDNCTTLIVPRRKIAKARRAKGEHEFTREELAKMFYVADVRDKAILSTAISLGYSIQDFSQLPRNLIESLVKKAIEEKMDFIGFDYERKKTHVEARSHLTPEARESLKAWFEYTDRKRESQGKPKSEWVWCNGNNGHLSDQALNDVIKSLIAKANITTTGKIRFHLLRKFLTNALHDAGFSSWEVKRIIAKEIPTSDATYLQGLSRKVSEKFPQVYNYIRLTGYVNKNSLRVEELEQKMQQMEIGLEHLTQQNLALQQILQFAIPKKSIIEAINQLMIKHQIDSEELEDTKRDLEITADSDLEDLMEQKLIELYLKMRKA